MTNEPLQQEDFEVLTHYGKVMASVQEFELGYRIDATQPLGGP